MHLARGNNAFGFRADVDEDAVSIGPHDLAFDDVAAVQRSNVQALLLEQGLHVFENIVIGSVFRPSGSQIPTSSLAGL